MALDLATLLLGFTWACASFTCIKAIKQTYMCWLRSRKVNAYIVMVWLEWSSCLTVSIVSWMCLQRGIRPSFGYLFLIVAMWVIEVQCTTQIIINRVSLIMFNPPRASRLKWTVAVFIGIINVSVFCVWIPAHLHANPAIMRANQIWERTEKSIFLVLELGLNSYFMWLIHSELIANGLRKYHALFKLNVAMVVLSVSLDGVIIGVISLHNDLIYVQFHAPVFLIKLHIEMIIAEMIGKIAQTTAGSGNRTSLHSPRRTTEQANSARFSCSVSWQECFRLDSWKHPIAKPVAGGHDDDGGRYAVDLESGRLARTQLNTSSREGSRTRDDNGKTATSEVDWIDWMCEIQKQPETETCDDLGSGGLRSRSEAPVRSWGRRFSI